MSLITEILDKRKENLLRWGLDDNQSNFLLKNGELERTFIGSMTYFKEKFGVIVNPIAVYSRIKRDKERIRKEVREYERDR